MRRPSRRTVTSSEVGGGACRNASANSSALITGWTAITPEYPTPSLRAFFDGRGSSGNFPWSFSADVPAPVTDHRAGVRDARCRMCQKHPLLGHLTAAHGAGCGGRGEKPPLTVNRGNKWQGFCSAIWHRSAQRDERAVPRRPGQASGRCDGQHRSSGATVLHSPFTCRHILRAWEPLRAEARGQPPLAEQ
jgi:hypothetical protein